MIKYTNSRVGINNTGKGIGGKAFIGSCQSPGKEPVYLTFIMFNYCFVSTTHIVTDIFSVMTNQLYFSSIISLFKGSHSLHLVWLHCSLLVFLYINPRVSTFDFLEFCTNPVFQSWPRE